MDSTQEDVSARLLLRNILHTEQLRTPVTRSWSRVAPGHAEAPGLQGHAEAQGSIVRRSLRSRKSLPGTSQTPQEALKMHLKRKLVAQRDVETQRPQDGIVRRSPRKSLPGTSQTPQEALKRHLKRKLRESASRSSLAPVMKRLSGVRQPRPMTSLLYDDDDITPRRLLQNIIHTEAVVSPALHVRSEGGAEGSDHTADISVADACTSIELDFPDVTMVTTASTVKRLRRMRPQPSFNVTAFEKQLEPDQDAELQDSGHELSSLSTSLGSTLSLKTPAVYVSTGKGGLRRKAQRQTKFSIDEFSAAVQQRQLAGGHAEGEERVHDPPVHETPSAVHFTLEQSDLPDITVDVIHRSTTLYAAASGLSIVDTDASEVEDHPSTEEDELIPRSITGVEPVAIETGEEEGAETNVEEEEQGEPEAMETQSEDEVPGDRKASGQPGVEHSSSRARSEGHLLKEHRSEGHRLREHRSEGHLLREHRSEGHLLADGQRGRDSVSIRAMDPSNLEEDEADALPPVGLTYKADDESIHSSSDQVEEVEVQAEEEEQGEPEAMETQSEEEVPGDRKASGQPGVERSSSRARSEGHLLKEHRSEGHILREHRSEGHLLKEHRSEGHLLADGQRGRGSVSIGAMDPSNLEEDEADALPPVGLTNEADDESIHSSSDQGEEVEVQAEEEGAETNVEEEEQGEPEAMETQSEEEVPGDQKASGQPGVERSSSRARSEGHLLKEHRSEGHLLREHRSEGHLLADGQRGRGSVSIGAMDPSKLEQDEADALPPVGLTYEADDESIHSSSDQVEDQEQEVEVQGVEEEEEEEEGEVVHELSMKTPAFVREKRIFLLEEEGSVAPQQSLPDTQEAPAQPRKVKAKRTRAAGGQARLPKSYLLTTFKHFAKTRVATDVYPVLDKTVDAFLERMSVDLETYAHHAKRKSIEVADVELLLRRQGYVNDNVPVAVLIEKYLPMEYRKMLIPVATSGNIVIPKMK